MPDLSIIRCHAHRLGSLLMLAAGGLAGHTALAAPASPAAAVVPALRADPLDPRAQVPTPTYASPLAGYRRLGDLQPVPWARANEIVNRIGGWRAYAREAQQAEPAPGASPPAAPGPAGRGGHAGH